MFHHAYLISASCSLIQKALNEMYICLSKIIKSDSDY